jgi:hypothetical protein
MKSLAISDHVFSSVLGACGITIATANSRIGKRIPDIRMLQPISSFQSGETAFGSSGSKWHVWTSKSPLTSYPRPSSRSWSGAGIRLDKVSVNETEPLTFSWYRVLGKSRVHYGTPCLNFASIVTKGRVLVPRT